MVEDQLNKTFVGEAVFDVVGEFVLEGEGARLQPSEQT
jgi:hypothetical protein